MGKFNYIAAESTAARLIDKFGETVNLLRYDATYDPVTGQTSSEVSQITEATLVSLPASQGTVEAFDNRTKEAFIQGKLRFFIVAAKNLSFLPLPGDYINFESALWEIMGSTPLNPAGTTLMFRVGAQLGNKQL
tara:strand:- start:709 stop:1110 length:402 start_codon:yes stop_codon:yes gene_type:complete